jgi:hypothetical protein
VKLVAEPEREFHLNSSPSAAVALPALSTPPLFRYQERARVPGIGSRENEASNPGYGAPGLELPAPLSNSTRTGARRWNAASADAWSGSDWIGSGGAVTPLMPSPCWYRMGTNAFCAGDSTGSRWAT